MNTKKYFITLFSFIIFSIYFTLSGVFVPFIASIPQSNGGFKTLSSQNDFYKMVDNFYDPDEFYNFRTDNQNINILANFYNTLNASSNFDVLTSFNQAIAVDDFNGDQRFYYNSDEFIDNSQSPTINIKALQLNQKAYDFYNIEVEGNSEIAWNSISYKDNSIPVLLGSEYKSFYKIGDIITGNYYSKNTNFEVIGFIETDCSINYKNTSNITLDTYMLIPYPSLYIFIVYIFPPLINSMLCKSCIPNTICFPSCLMSLLPFSDSMLRCSAPFWSPLPYFFS